MLINVKGQVDWNHHDIILAESLVDKNDNFYDLTLQQALNEILAIDQEALEYCEYQIDRLSDEDYAKRSEFYTDPQRESLRQFQGWTKTKVIFMYRGMNAHDTLLDYVNRNPPS